MCVRLSMVQRRNLALYGSVVPRSFYGGEHTLCPLNVLITDLDSTSSCEGY